MNDLDFEQYDLLCKKSLDKISQIYEFCAQEHRYNTTVQYESGLEIMDYAYAIMIGIIGAYVTSSPKVQAMLDQIHQIASAETTNNKFELLIKELLGHNKDYIDSIPVNGTRKFVSRTKGASRSGPHRIFWGHDFFSFKRDNPLLLMEQQAKEIAETGGKIYIPGKGVMHALKHLTADTFSTQGIPIPTSSWWDYTYTDKKGALKQGNRLLGVCNQIYKETNSSKVRVTGANNEIFNHMFSIHFQDIAVQKIDTILCDQYLRVKKIKDEIIQHQFKFINYSVLFWVNCILGGIRYSIPYINWASGAMLIKEFCLLGHSNWREIRQLERKTEALICETEQLEERVMGMGKRIQILSPKEQIAQYDGVEKRLNEWIKR